MAIPANTVRPNAIHTLFIIVEYTEVSEHRKQNVVLESRLYKGRALCKHRNMLYHIFDTIFPVFGLIALGCLMKQARFLPESFFKAANKLAFWFALPCLLFQKIAVAELAMGQASKILIVLFVATTAMIVISWVAARALHLKPTSLAAVVHCSFRGNLAYIGLPVILYSLQSEQIPNLPEAEALAVLCLAPIVPFYNIVAILFMQSAASSRRISPLKLLVESLKNPLVVACLLGLVFSAMRWRMPGPIGRGVGLVAQLALPLSLLAIGAALSIKAIKGSHVPASTATALKIFVTPAIGLLLARMLNLDPVHARIAVVYLAAPTAIAAYVMTEQMKCDAEVSSSTVVMTTIFSIISLSAAIILT